MSLSEQQRGVLKGIVAAAAVTAVALAGVVWWRPDFLVPGVDIGARLGFVLAADLRQWGHAPLGSTSHWGPRATGVKS